MNLAALEPVVIFTLLNVAMALGLYVTAHLRPAVDGDRGHRRRRRLPRRCADGEVRLASAARRRCSPRAAGALVGTVLALVTLKMRDFILKLTTLAFGEALAVLAFNWDYIGGANSFTGIGLKTTIWTALAATAIALYVAWRLTAHDWVSRRARCATIRSRRAPWGSRSPWCDRLSFAVGGALVGMGGAIQGHYVLVISPHDLGFFVSLNFIIFLLFGGLQTLWGPVLGAVLLTALPEMLRFTNEYRLILYGLIIVLVVLLRPDGVLTRTPTGRPVRFFGVTLIPGRAVATQAADLRARPQPSVSLTRQPAE